MGMDNASPTKTPKYVEVLRELALCTFENRAGRVDNPLDRHNDAPFDGAGMLGEMQFHVDSSVRDYGMPASSLRLCTNAKMEEALAWAMAQPRAQAAMLWVAVRIERDHEAALAEDAVRSTCERCASGRKDVGSNYCPSCRAAIKATCLNAEAEIDSDFRTSLIGASLVLYSAQEAAEAERHNGQQPTVGACLVLEVSEDGGFTSQAFGFKSFEADGAEIG